MAIDAQSIASIGQNAPDIAGSTMKAYTLADAIDRRQLNQMTLQSTREEQADLSKIKTLSQQYDISNPEQRHELASRVQKEVGGKYAMDFMRMADEQDRRSAELSAAQMQNYQAKHEVMTNAILPMYQQIQASTQQGMPPGQIEAQLLPAFKQTLDTLMKQTLPNGEKVLNQQDIQQISTMLSGQPGALLSGINSAMASSRTAQEFFAKQRKEARDEANVQSEISARGNKIETVMKNGKPMRVEFNAKGEEVRTLGEAPPTAATVQVGGPNAQSLLGELALRGVNIPARTAGAVVAGLKKNYPGKSDAELADMVVTGQATLAGVKAEKRVEGTTVGKTETAIGEISQFAEKALAASAKVPRGEFRRFNKLRLYADTELSNPDLKELKSYLNSLSNAYDVAAARGGTDVNKRAEAHAMLDAADSPETLARAIKVMQDEAAIALNAGQSALRGGQTSTPGPASPTAAPSPAATGGAGGGTSQEITATGPNGQQLVLRNGQWVPK